MTATLTRPPAASLAERFADEVKERAKATGADPGDVARSALAALSDSDRTIRAWRWWARPDQLAPGTVGAANPRTDWRWWALITGRGFGKTRSGGEWVADRAQAFAEAGVIHRVGAIAPTAADARDTMVEGESGLLAVCERRKVDAIYEPSKRRVTIAYDPKRPTVVILYSSERPDRVRGLNAHTIWCEEMAAWLNRVDAHGGTAWSNADLALRLPCPAGLLPQGVVTTTPKPIPDIAALVEDAKDPSTGVVLTGGALTANLRNLHPAFVRAVLNRYEGTALGDQEILGLLLEAVDGALWTREVLNEWRVEASRLPAAPAPDDEIVTAEQLVGWHRETVLALGVDTVVVGVDPPGGGSAECGIVAVGLNSAESVAYTLEDASLEGPPEVWGAAVVDVYRRWGAARVVAESNYGGEMVRSTIHVVDSTVAYRKVTAKVGKALRAQPIAALTARGRARHAGQFGALEAQQVSWVEGDPSPDRLDAYVYAVTDLLGAMTRAPASAASPNRAGSRRSGRTARWGGATRSARARRRP